MTRSRGVLKGFMSFRIGGGGGVLPYMGYIGAAPKGRVFQPFCS